MMYRVLLVDDEQNVLNALLRELRSSYQVETFTSPVAALQHCQDTAFDLVISDYKMPDMNGITFLKKLAEIQPHIARIVLSGQADIDGLMGAINETHVYCFIAKPWDKSDLITSIEQALAYRAVVLENHCLADRYRNAFPLAQATTHNDPYRILLVDGDEAVVAMMQRGLAQQGGDEAFFGGLRQDMAATAERAASHGFTVATFTSARQALAYAKQHDCDLVIAAEKLPDMDGVQFLASFMKICPDTARIMISDHPDNRMLSQAINEARVDGFLNISWNTFELKADVRRQSWNNFQLKSAVMHALARRDLALENRHLAELAATIGSD